MSLTDSFLVLGGFHGLWYRQIKGQHYTNTHATSPPPPPRYSRLPGPDSVTLCAAREEYAEGKQGEPVVTVTVAAVSSSSPTRVQILTASPDQAYLRSVELECAVADLDWCGANLAVATCDRIVKIVDPSQTGTQR